MNLRKELYLAEQIAQESGKLALSLKPDINIYYKPNEEGPVTSADLAVDQMICDFLKENFPQDQVISEESYVPQSSLSLERRTWLVDPIDGTRSYIAGRDDYAIMIGLLIMGVPRIGVVYQPQKNIMWSAIYSCGEKENICTRKRKGIVEEIAINNFDSMPKELHVVSSRSQMSIKQDAALKILKPKSILRQSSVGIKTMTVVDRKADIYIAWSKRIKLWDTCAPFAIAMASGAYVATVDGKPVVYYKGIEHGLPIIVANFFPTQNLLGKFKTFIQANH